MVVVVAAEVGVGPPIRRCLPCSGGVGCVVVVAEWVWVGGLWWRSGFMVRIDIGCGLICDVAWRWQWMWVFSGNG